jgi:hypothetical protein
VVRLQPAPKETYRAKLASCWRDIELDHEFGDQGLRWSPQQATLRVEWLAGPTSGGREAREFQVSSDGAVRATTPR